MTAEKQISLDFFGRAVVPRAETERPLKNLKMEGKSLMKICHMIII